MKLKKILRAHCNDDVQDNMIDEEKAKAEEAAQEAIEQKLERLEGNLGSIRSLEIQGKVKDKDRIRQRQIRAKNKDKYGQSFYAYSLHLVVAWLHLWGIIRASKQR